MVIVWSIVSGILEEVLENLLFQLLWKIFELEHSALSVVLSDTVQSQLELLSNLRRGKLEDNECKNK